MDLRTIRSRLNEFLDDDLKLDSIHSPRLVEGMRYAVLGGGKRLRGCFVCATTLSLDGTLDWALAPAAAVEYMHAYSLVHDDLPDMDDSPLRRGKPSCHAEFGASTAILVGDALQSLAYSTIANCTHLDPEQRVVALQILSDSSGWEHMVGGQALDMELEHRTVDNASVLDVLNDAKTGALFRACAGIGAVVAGYDRNSIEFQSLVSFAKNVGAAFQITDDVLDATRHSDDLGKPTGADASAGKNNYVSYIGVEGARRKAEELLDSALSLLAHLRLKESTLAELAALCVNRAT